MAQNSPRIESGYDPKVDDISEKYEAGAFLIYDCQEGHWVCVLESSYRECEAGRKKALIYNHKVLPCAPIGEFPTKRSCFDRSLFLVTHGHGERFCLSDEIKPRELVLQ